MGVAVLPADADGSVRFYRRRYSTSRGELPSFATAVLDAGGTRSALVDDRRPRLIEYRSLLPTDSSITVQWVLENADSPDFQGEQGVLRGKVVLLGGTFRAGRDWYPTPLGWMSGVDVWGQVLQTELDGGGPAQPSPWRLGLLQFLVGFGLVALFEYLPLSRAFWAAVLGLPPAAALASLVVFGSVWFVIYFLPVFALVLIQQLYDQAKGYRDSLLLRTSVDKNPVPDPTPGQLPAPPAPADQPDPLSAKIP
jgi:hypothetical protein